MVEKWRIHGFARWKILAIFKNTVPQQVLTEYLTYITIILLFFKQIKVFDTQMAN